MVTTSTLSRGLHQLGQLKRLQQRTASKETIHDSNDTDLGLDGGRGDSPPNITRIPSKKVQPHSRAITTRTGPDRYANTTPGRSTPSFSKRSKTPGTTFPNITGPATLDRGKEVLRGLLKDWDVQPSVEVLKDDTVPAYTAHPKTPGTRPPTRPHKTPSSRSGSRTNLAKTPTELSTSRINLAQTAKEKSRSNRVRFEALSLDSRVAGVGVKNGDARLPSPGGKERREKSTGAGMMERRLPQLDQRGSLNVNDERSLGETRDFKSQSQSGEVMTATSTNNHSSDHPPSGQNPSRRSRHDAPIRLSTAPNMHPPSTLSTATNPNEHIHPPTRTSTSSQTATDHTRPPWNPNTNLTLAELPLTPALRPSIPHVEPSIPLYLLPNRPTTVHPRMRSSTETPPTRPKTQPNPPSTPHRRRHHSDHPPTTKPKPSPPTPPESTYDTRPMSPHKPYNLSTHLRAAAMRMRPPDLKDNFNARMRALFLPSLFQSTDDISVNRLTSVDDTLKRTTTAAPPVEDQDEDVMAKFEFGKARSAARKALRAANVSTFDDTQTIRYTSRSAKRRLPIVNPRLHPGLVSPKSQKHMKYPLATIDKAAFDLNPPDLSRILLLWRFAIHSVCKMHRVRHDVLEDKTKTENDRDGDVVLVKEVIEEKVKDRLEVIAAMRVKRLLDIPVNVREDRDLDEMDAILGRFKVFSRLPPSHRYKLYNSCKLHTYSRNTSLIHESHPAKQMYILLLGECLLQIRPNHPTASVNLRLGVGGAAGEFQTFALNEVRNMRAVCTMRTLVMVIDKGEFVTVAREARTVDNYVAEFFATVPSLLSADKQLPVFLSQRGIVRRYDPETLLIRATEPCPNVYFIIRGKCRALHMVTFIKQDLGPAQDALSTVLGSHARHHYSLTPYTPTQTLQPSDELVRELATVVELGPGQMFPPLVGAKVSHSDTDDLDARRRKYADAPPPPPFHFVVIEKLECVVISHADLLETVPREVFAKLCDSSMGMTEVSAQEIEERYLASQGWRGSRDLDVSVMKDLVDPDAFKDESWSNPVVKRKNRDGVEVVGDGEVLRDILGAG